MPTPGFTSIILAVVGSLAIALAFLLLGWKLGRDSKVQPMFHYAPTLKSDPPEAFDETDPWDAAMDETPAAIPTIKEN